MLICLVVALSLLSCSGSGDSTLPEAPVYGYRVVNSFPHDSTAWTQGLILDDGILYESTGLRGSSSVRRVDLETGRVLQQHYLSDQLFGEGLTIVGDKAIQLTWQLHVGIVYDKETLEQVQTFSYPTEGWGLTYDGQRLIMSDGGPVLHFIDPATFDRIGRVQVRDRRGTVTRLNELEYIDGEVWANILESDRIARINPTTGEIVAWIDLTGLLDRTGYPLPVDVLNGIAYDAASQRLFVTGKLWPRLFEIELIPPAS